MGYKKKYLRIGQKNVLSDALKCANLMGLRPDLKELTEGHHQEWSLWLNLTQHGKSHQARTPEGLTD